MKLTVQHFHVRSCDELDSLIEDRILALRHGIEIEEARVRLACRYDESPAFSVHIHLVTPGPDVYAESRDHTLRAAVEKAIGQLENQIGGRHQKRLRRLRSNLQAPALFRMGSARRA